MTSDTHLWLRAEQRPNETRVGLTPEGAKSLLDAGFRLTVEESTTRVIPTQDYADVGATIAPENAWPSAPHDAVILGLKELPEDGTPLVHRHIMFGHAYKGQFSGQELLRRFKAGGGALLDLEYLLDENGRRVAAFGYWAGFSGAAVTLRAWIAQQKGGICGPVGSYPNKDQLIADLEQSMDQFGGKRPSALVIGALGRVGTGASDLCAALGIEVTKWDIAETAHGGPFPEILEHDLLFNCILAHEGVPQFVPPSTLTAPRKLCAIGDIACDPDSSYNPIPIYDRATDWNTPVLRVHKEPVLDVMAIDNLPSLLPLESSLDFAEQLLPSLLQYSNPDSAVWTRAFELYQRHIGDL